jgi:hypothetical protein
MQSSITHHALATALLVFLASTAVANSCTAIATSLAFGAWQQRQPESAVVDQRRQLSAVPVVVSF